MLEKNIKARQTKLENSKGFPHRCEYRINVRKSYKSSDKQKIGKFQRVSHDKIVQLLRLGAARANVHKAISGEITYEHRFRKIDRNSSTYSPVYQTQAGENAEGLGVGPDGQASRMRKLAP